VTYHLLSMRVAILLFALLTFAAPLCEARPLAMKPGHVGGSVKVNGQKRTFKLYIPKDRGTSERLPLVIVLHGALGNSWSAQYDSGMSEQAEKDHFIVAYPNGEWRTWNAGGCCGPARVMKVDDVGFIRELIHRVKNELPVDQDRIYVTGISNGGMMAYRLAGELADEIAAIAPIEGCMYPFKLDSSVPVSVVSIHGTEDKIIRYDGGTGSMFGYKVTAKSVSDTIQFWVMHDHCNAQPVHEEHGNVVKDLYTNGKNGTEVCLYTLKENGHAWPGGRRCTFLGDTPKDDLAASEAICSFFMSHPKQHKDVTAELAR
jgi:polyhydroxybutyrate depolymerase